MAAQRLLETDGAALEIDLRLSKGGVPVVLHEETLDGVTTGHGLVGQRTAEDLSIRLRVDGAVTADAVPAGFRFFGPRAPRAVGLDVADVDLTCKRTGWSAFLSPRPGCGPVLAGARHRLFSALHTGDSFLIRAGFSRRQLGWRGAFDRSEDEDARAAMVAHRLETGGTHL